jgi:hypothetical protein
VSFALVSHRTESLALQGPAREAVAWIIDDGRV